MGWAWGMGGGQKVIFICLSVLREYLGRDLVMPNLPFNFLMTLRERSMTTEGNIWRIPGNTCVHLFRTISRPLGVVSILRCIDDADRCIKLVRVFLTGLYEVDMVQDDTGWCQVVPGYS